MAGVVGLTVDFTEFNAATHRAYNMGQVRRRDIANIFRTENKEVVKWAKRIAGKSKRGATSLKYPSRTHTAGNLRRGIKFKVSKRYVLVYYVVSSAWYSMIYSGGHGSWGGSRFMKVAWDIQASTVTNNIKQRLGKLTEETWKNG